MIEYVCICGSREYPDEQQVLDYVAGLPNETVIISGGAPGVDSWAAGEARRRGMVVHFYPADWKRYGRQAGFLRNVEMVKAANRIVAFWDGRSRGTRHTIDIANREGKPCEVIRPTETRGRRLP